MSGGLVGFERGDSSDDDSSADSDVFGGGSSSSGSGRSPGDLEGTVSFGDGDGPSRPTGGFDPIPGGVDETTTGRAPGSRSNYPFVRPEDSHRVSVKNVWLTEDGNVAFRVRGTGLREDKRVRVPIRVDGQLVGRETITLPAGLPDKTVKTDVSPSTGSKIAASNVFMEDVGGGALGRTSSGSSQESGSDSSGAPKSALKGRVNRALSNNRIDNADADRLKRGIKSDAITTVNAVNTLIDRFAKPVSDGSLTTPSQSSQPTNNQTGMFAGFERGDSGGDISTDSNVFGSDSEKSSSNDGAGSSSAMIVLVAVVGTLALLARRSG